MEYAGIEMILAVVVIVTFVAAVVLETFRRRFFLPVLAAMLVVFKFAVGNPMGLLASGGGWPILTAMIMIAVGIASALDWIRSNTNRARPS